MIRKTSKPTDEVIYGDYKPWINVLFVVSIAGSIYSGMTEWNGFKSDELAVTFPILYPTIGILLIESLRVIAPSLFLTISRMTKKFEVKRIPILLVLLALVVALFTLSIMKSDDGIDYKAEKEYAFDDSFVVDSSKYNMLCQSCKNKWFSDSLVATGKAKAAHGKDLEKQIKAKRAANQRISEIKHSTENWAVKTVASMTNLAKASLANINELKGTIKEAARDSLDLAKSQYTGCLASASDTLLRYRRIAEQQHNVAKQDNATGKERKKSRNYFLMFTGVVFIILHAMARQWLYHVSGVEVTYVFNASDNTVGFTQKFTTLFSASVKNWSESILGVLWTGNSVELKDDEVTIIKKSDAEKKQKMAQQALDIEKKRLTDEAAIAEKRKELEMIKAETDRQNVLIEKERLALKAERRKAEIQAKKDKDALAASTLADEKRLKELAAAELETKREEIRREERIRLEQQEKERLAKQEEAVEAARQQSIKTQQENATRKRLADEAEKLAAEKLEKERLEQQEKRRLATAMETLNKKNATGNKTDLPDVQRVVDEMFEKYIENSQLVINKYFKTAIKNYYKRWIAATESLKDASLSEGRRIQKEKASSDNQAKFEYSIDKAANMNVEIKVDATGKVVIEYMVNN